jgi:hypothetical protein
MCHGCTHSSAWTVTAVPIHKVMKVCTSPAFVMVAQQCWNVQFKVWSQLLGKVSHYDIYFWLPRHNFNLDLYTFPTHFKRNSDSLVTHTPNEAQRPCPRNLALRNLFNPFFNPAISCFIPIIGFWRGSPRALLRWSCCIGWPLQYRQSGLTIASSCARILKIGLECGAAAQRWPNKWLFQSSSTNPQTPTCWVGIP